MRAVEGGAAKSGLSRNSPGLHNYSFKFNVLRKSFRSTLSNPLTSESPESSGSGREAVKRVESAGQALAHYGMAGGSRPQPASHSATWYDHDELLDDQDSRESVQSSSGVDLEDGEEDEKTKLLHKINHVKDRLRQENLSREVDVDEYIRLTQELPITPDNPQLMRIRQVFEKKNKKHSQAAEQLQKKLEAYNQRVKDLERGIRPETSKKGENKNVLTNVHQGLKEISTNIKDSITDYTGSVIAVPKDLASKLRHKFGSADNLPVIVDSDNDSSDLLNRGASLGMKSRLQETAKFYTDPAELDDRNPSRALSEEGGGGGSVGEGRHSRDGAASAPLHSPTHFRRPSGQEPLRSPDEFQRILNELAGIQQRQTLLTDSLEQLRQYHQRECTDLHNILHEEKFRYQRLEDQLNDTIELHQAEVQNLKLEIQSIGARTDYQHDERYRDLHEAVENAQNRVSRLEQTGLQQMGVGNPEGMNAVALRSINVLVLVLQVLLVLVSTVAQFVQPFIRTRSRALLAVLSLALLVISWRSKAALDGLIWQPILAKFSKQQPLHAKIQQNNISD